MNVNRESGKALTVNAILKPFKLLALLLAIFTASYILLASLPEPEISWNVRKFDEDGSFACFPYIYQKPHSIGLLRVHCFRFLLDRYDSAAEAFLYCSGMLEQEMKNNRPFRLEAQYIVENGSARISVLGFYTQNGEQVDISRDFPLKYKYFRHSDYGPLEYTEDLLYIPDEVRQERLKEMSENRKEIENLVENGTVLRRHRVFFSILFTLLLLFAAYRLAKYRRCHNPRYSVGFIFSGRDPSAEFYYVLPTFRADSSVFGRENLPADYILREEAELSRGVADFKRICESHRGDIPARFEGSYSVTTAGSMIELRGYYTENGIRKDLNDRITFDFCHFPNSQDPPDELRPYLGY